MFWAPKDLQIVVPPCVNVTDHTNFARWYYILSNVTEENSYQNVKNKKKTAPRFMWVQRNSSKRVYILYGNEPRAVSKVRERS